MPLEPGEALPTDLQVLDADGRTIALSQLRGRVTLLILLRHLGCLPCQEHLRDVAARKDELDAQVACIAFARPALLPGFARKTQLPFRLYTDPERTTYRALGFERGSARRVWLDRRVWKRYAQLLRRGRRLQSSREDTLQLGGDAVLDADGRVVWVYRSQGPEDRPPVDDVIRAVGRARAGAP